jgi:hypothetical protein
MKSFFTALFFVIASMGIFVLGVDSGISIGCSSGIYESARLGGFNESIDHNKDLLMKRCLNEEGSHAQHADIP